MLFPRLSIKDRKNNTHQTGVLPCAPGGATKKYSDLHARKKPNEMSGHHSSQKVNSVHIPPLLLLLLLFFFLFLLTESPSWVRLQYLPFCPDDVMSTYVKRERLNARAVSKTQCRLRGASPHHPSTNPAISRMWRRSRLPVRPPYSALFPPSHLRALRTRPCVVLSSLFLALLPLVFPASQLQCAQTCCLVRARKKKEEKKKRSSMEGMTKKKNKTYIRRCCCCFFFLFL